MLVFLVGAADFFFEKHQLLCHVSRLVWWSRKLISGSTECIHDLSIFWGYLERVTIDLSCVLKKIDLSCGGVASLCAHTYRQHIIAHKHSKINYPLVKQTITV